MKTPPPGKPAALLASLFVVLLMLLWTAVAPHTLAQTEPALQLTLRRDFGAGFGANIQGTFSMRVTGPDNLERVEFLLDGQTIGAITGPPFHYQFRTDAYPPGPHTLSATGVTADGQTLTSNTISRNFLSGGESFRAMLWLVVPVIALVIGGLWLTSRLAQRGQSEEMVAINGPFGGSICPKCQRPFARHWWGLNIVVGKYDRCPHCGKWSIVQRAHPDILEAALQAMRQADTTADAPLPPTNDEDAFRRRLDDSRFD